MLFPTGPIAAKKIRELGYDGVILGLTGMSSKEDQEVFLSQGADGMLVKPLDLDELNRWIDSKHLLNHLIVSLLMIKCGVIHLFYL